MLGKQAGPLPDRQLAGHKGRAARGMECRVLFGCWGDRRLAACPGNAWQNQQHAATAHFAGGLQATAGFWTAA